MLKLSKRQPCGNRHSRCVLSRSRCHRHLPQSTGMTGSLVIFVGGRQWWMMLSQNRHGTSVRLYGSSKRSSFTQGLTVVAWLGQKDNKEASSASSSAPAMAGKIGRLHHHHGMIQTLISWFRRRCFRLRTCHVTAQRFRTRLARR